MIKLSVGKNYFYANSNDREEIVQLLKDGFQFDRETGFYKTPSLRIFSKYREHLTPEQRLFFNRYFIFKNECPPLIAKKPLLYFQPDGAKWALTRNRAFLNIAPGGGKTPIAWTTINSDPGKTLIVAPAYLIYMWGEIAWAEWSMAQEVYIVDQPTFDREKFDSAEVVIVPDSRLHAMVDVLHAVKWHRIIIDEVHRFKTRASQRGAALWGRNRRSKQVLVWVAKNVLVLSGTPMPNRPMELFPYLKLLAPEVIDFLDVDGFGQRWCGGFFNGQSFVYDGASNTEDLKERLHRDFMFTISRDMVKSKLPPLLEETVLVGNKLPKEIFALETKIRQSFNADLDKMIDEMEINPHIATYRRMVGQFKVDLVADIIKDILIEYPTEKIVVFAVHKEVIEALHWHFINDGVTVIDGTTKPKDRQGLVDDFQLSPFKRILIGNIKACGEGLTIVVPTRVCLVEFDWSPTTNWQAIDRVHRMTQKSTCFAQYFALRGSLDVDMLNKNRAKVKTINEILGDKTP